MASALLIAGITLSALCCLTVVIARRKPVVLKADPVRIAELEYELGITDEKPTTTIVDMHNLYGILKEQYQKPYYDVLKFTKESDPYPPLNRRVYTQVDLPNEQEEVY